MWWGAGVEDCILQRGETEGEGEGVAEVLKSTEDWKARLVSILGS